MQEENTMQLSNWKRNGQKAKRYRTYTKERNKNKIP